MTQLFTLHPQLEKDTHCLFDNESYFILLHKNATIPWIIIVPKTHQIEIFELSDEEQRVINTLTQSIAQVFRQEFSSEKMNIAAIGNIVPQLHLHVIGRKSGDACWPGVVWGANYPDSVYTLEQINHLRAALSKINDNIL